MSTRTIAGMMGALTGMAASLPGGLEAMGPQWTGYTAAVPRGEPRLDRRERRGLVRIYSCSTSGRPKGVSLRTVTSLRAAGMLAGCGHDRSLGMIGVTSGGAEKARALSAARDGVRGLVSS